jgi:hypothetical protein
MTYLSRQEIGELGSFADRKNSYDDDNELEIFCRFLKTNFLEKYQIVQKPYGPYGVDIGIFFDNDLVCAFDLERCKTWKNDWPSNWRCLSFLSRKDEHLKFPQFGMVWFNNSLTKFAIAWKKDILKYPVEKRYVNGKEDPKGVRKVNFNHGKLYGSSFNLIETERFKNRVEYELK